MQEGGEGGGWLKWALIVPLCVAGGALLARVALNRAGPAAVPAAAPAAEAPSAAADAKPAAPAPDGAVPAATQGNFELQSDDYTTGEAGVVWGGTRTAAAPPAAAAPAAPAAPADPVRVKKDTETGFMYGALTKLSGKLMDNPKALTALFNNDYVVKGFMSRDTVKQATASKASLAAYLGNPANVNKFLSKAPVQEGLKRPELLRLMAGTKMVSEMMDTPGGRALSQDPAALAKVVQANPALVPLLTDPGVLAALMSNPKTAGLASQGLSAPRK